MIDVIALKPGDRLQLREHIVAEVTENMEEWHVGRGSLSRGAEAIGYRPGRIVPCPGHRCSPDRLAGHLMRIAPMLRYEFMPSDFNPIFLILGDQADLARLSATLRLFAHQGEAMSLAAQMPEFQPQTPLTIARSDDAFGLRRSGSQFVWYLNEWQALQIADRIEALAAQAKSGSDIFEIGSDGEIPVKVSHGEFTDDFLVSRR
jgi:hypothetical protein